MLPFDERGAARRADDDERDDADGTKDAHDTPPFGLGVVTDDTAPESGPAPAPTPGSPVPPAAPFEIRDRLIELDDLRKRGIISEEEFAAKKSELLNRI
jgi:hypothetical protein